MYTESLMGMFPVGTGAIGAETVSAAVAVHGEWLVATKLQIRRIMFYVTTAIAASVTPPQVAFKKRIIQGSASGGSTIGTLILPDLTAAGKVVYKDVTPVALEVGDVLALEHTVQAVDGSSAAGAGYYMWECELYPEYKSNQSDMVASA